jgi:hypothetical protein
MACRYPPATRWHCAVAPCHDCRMARLRSQQQLWERFVCAELNGGN